MVAACAFHHFLWCDMRECVRAAGQAGTPARVIRACARANDALSPRYSFAIIIVVVVKDNIVIALVPARAAARFCAADSASATSMRRQAVVRERLRWCLLLIIFRWPR